MLATGQSIDIVSYSVFLPLIIFQKEVEYLLGCGKQKYLTDCVNWSPCTQTMHFLPKVSYSESQRSQTHLGDPILVTEPKKHVTCWWLQGWSSLIIPGPVAILISVRALAQAEVLTNHRKVATRVTTKSIMGGFRLSRYRFV